MRRARAENATTVVSIFVNPRQFDVAADFAQYPRNEARDLAICEAEGVDLVFAPAGRRGLSARASTRPCRSGRVAAPLEGAARPGHFDGVATVVAILFGLVGAERAYFGQKDAQQVMVIRQMARDLAIADRGRRLPDGPGAGRPRAVVAQRPPLARPSAPRRRSCAGRCSRRATRGEAGERSGDGAARRDARGARRRAARGRRVRLGAPTARRSPSSTRVDGPALLSLAVRFGATRLIDNERVT